MEEKINKRITIDKDKMEIIRNGSFADIFELLFGKGDETDEM